jgi:hypothetical protein
MCGESNDRPVGELSSPACSMREAEDAYMGYAAKSEIVTLLDELLAAEHRALDRLREMLPRVRDDELYARLDDLRVEHERHIALIRALKP